jgi:hypothetical protein
MKFWNKFFRFDITRPNISDRVKRILSDSNDSQIFTTAVREKIKNPRKKITFTLRKNYENKI